MKIVRKIIYPLPLIVLIISIIYIIYLKTNLNKNKFLLSEEMILENKVTDDIEYPNEISYYTIDIKGAVKKPGVYQIPINSNVNDAINLAGGLNNNADTSLINLSKKVSDEMVIIIYTKEEVKNSNIVNNVIKVVEKECICPNIQNDSCLNNEIIEPITNKDKLININNATIEQLQTINGIGESKAKNIINYRNINGKFNSIEDLLNVDGIGQSLYEQIKIYITT